MSEIEVDSSQRKQAVRLVQMMYREYKELEEDGKFVFVIEFMRTFKNELIRIKGKM